MLTEYRGLDMTSIQTLRRALRDAGADYKVYKNTLARFAARDAGFDIEDQLVGPTAFAFTATKADGSPGDPVMLAKALKEFAKTNEALIIKGGLMDGALLSSDDVKALAEVAPREELLAQFAGLLAAPDAAVRRPAGCGPPRLRVRTPGTHRQAGRCPRHRPRMTTVLPTAPRTKATSLTPLRMPTRRPTPNPRRPRPRTTPVHPTRQPSLGTPRSTEASADAEVASTEAAEPDGGDDASAPDESEEE